jgi:hypothetical protein
MQDPLGFENAIAPWLVTIERDGYGNTETKKHWRFFRGEKRLPTSR